MTLRFRDDEARVRFKSFVPRAVLFDLDGTLIDSRGDIAAACNHARTVRGLPALPIERVRAFVGDGARLLLARAFEWSPDDARLDAALTDFREYYDAHPADFAFVLPGVMDLIAAIAPRPMAVVTNKPRATAELVLESLALRDRFVVVRGGGDGPLKPDPALVRSALAALAAGPAPDLAAPETWFIGDGPQDIGAGRTAGCFTIAIRGLAEEAALAAALPDATVDELADVTRAAR